MSGGLTFAQFAQAVDERLWQLGVVPSFGLDDHGARWSCAPYAAELEPLGGARARVVLFANGRPCYTSEPGRMTAAGARTLARAVGMLFGGRGVASAGTPVASGSYSLSYRGRSGARVRPRVPRAPASRALLPTALRPPSSA